MVETNRNHFQQHHYRNYAVTEHVRKEGELGDGDWTMGSPRPSGMDKSLITFKIQNFLQTILSMMIHLALVYTFYFVCIHSHFQILVIPYNVFSYFNNSPIRIHSQKVMLWLLVMLWLVMAMFSYSYPSIDIANCFLTCVRHLEMYETLLLTTGI